MAHLINHALKAAFLGVSLTACVGTVQRTDLRPAVDMTRSTEGNAVRTIQTGNGVKNNITLAGTAQAGATLTVPWVEISDNGWLVAHPFRDGAPVPTEYVASTYIEKGLNRDVPLVLDAEPAPGEWFAIMLHYDVNQDRVFDFGDGITVPDRPVFEDGALVSHRYKTKG